MYVHRHIATCTVQNTQVYFLPSKNKHRLYAEPELPKLIFLVIPKIYVETAALD